MTPISDLSTLGSIFKKEFADMLEAEVRALQHYVTGLDSDIPRSDIKLAMGIHITMLESKIEELRR